MNFKQITKNDQLELKKVYFDSIISIDDNIYTIVNTHLEAFKKKTRIEQAEIIKNDFTPGGLKCSISYFLASILVSKTFFLYNARLLFLAPSFKFVNLIKHPFLLKNICLKITFPSIYIQIIKFEKIIWEK